MPHKNPDALSDYFRTNTASGPALATDADFLFLHGQDEPTHLEQAKTGTVSYPDTNAFVIIDVDILSAHLLPDTLALTLTGPGINGQRTVFVGGLNPALLTTLREMNDEYPLGIDTILTDRLDQICCLPRSSNVIVNE